MQTTDIPRLHASTLIAASRATVWDLVHDPRRMTEWSPQVQSVRLRDGFDTVALGTQFTNRNQHGELAWTTHGEIIRFAPRREMAFRIEENYVVWVFELSDAPDGRTLLVQRRETPDGISALSRELTDGFMGGTEVFTETMRQGMAATLERIRDAAQSAT